MNYFDTEYASFVDYKNIFSFVQNDFNPSKKNCCDHKYIFYNNQKRLCSVLKKTGWHSPLKMLSKKGVGSKQVQESYHKSELS